MRVPFLFIIVLGVGLVGGAAVFTDTGPTTPTEPTGPSVELSVESTGCAGTPRTDDVAVSEADGGGRLVLGGVVAVPGPEASVTATVDATGRGSYVLDVVADGTAADCDATARYEAVLWLPDRRATVVVVHDGRLASVLAIEDVESGSVQVTRYGSERD